MNILLVEDEPSIAGMINKGLTEAGYTVTIAPDGNTGFQMAVGNTYELFIFDIMLPGINGLELCRMIRKSKNNTPILLLTALGTTDNVVAGLDTGADDYLIKPFKFAELLARIRALVRRKSGSFVEENKLKIADLELDLDARIVRRNNTEVSLTSTEYRMLEYFLKNQKKVISRMDLLENVWGVDFNMATNVVDVYVNYLRKKIDKDFEPKLLHTVIGMGYILKD
ncbi:DNA-binding response regulator [Flavipsychrobacter stenotrophus]|uniref:DNA-binding response regulator n=1 Tax=Flavipsychrobacter stenotrophus TaxID=2077091 RepID=A0A2S7T1X1_9BACT|nr:response regulator transcription factor [Flavipsychrobacter stenotrophus]PQJ12795.1 DNA-binding response regulator [Flavipsychrobacter stenotrophus]